jgi:putative NADH-flavin reductase
MKMKKIALIGASGYIGSRVLKEALDRGHMVTGIVRRPERITIVHPNLKAEKGDVSLPVTIPELCSGADVIISAYNPGWTNPDIATETTRVYRIIIDGVKKAGVTRFLVVGGAGSLFVAPGLRLMNSGKMPESYLPAVAALANVYLEMLTAENKLDWAFFSPAESIVPGTRTGIFRLGKDDLVVGPGGKSLISVEDYAVEMINEVENPLHHRERFTIGY